MTTLIEFTPAQLALIDRHRGINTDHDWTEYLHEQFAAALEAYGLRVTTRTVRLMNDKTRQAPDIRWSGFCSQGDGACFETDSFTLVDLLTAGRAALLLPDDHDLAWLKTVGDPVADRLRQEFERLEAAYGTCLLSTSAMELLGGMEYSTRTTSHQYSHSGNMSVDTDWGGDDVDDFNTTTQAFIEQLEDEAETLCDFLRELADLHYAGLEAEYDYQTSDDQVWETLVANDMTDEDEGEDEEDDACAA